MIKLGPRSIIRIAFLDSISNSCIWVIFCFWLLLFLKLGYRRPDYWLDALVLGVLSVFMHALVVWRVRRVRRILRNGVVKSGRIKSIRWFGFRESWITVEFPRGGQLEKARFSLDRKKAKKWGLAAGDEIGLIVDEAAPREALVRRMYS